MTRVLVGMSGGVDSSVAAARLAAEGYEVIGVSLQLYDHSRGGTATRCCSPEDFLDARRVADVFGFPYYVVNTEDLFRRKVLDYFVGEYGRGRTPNPCVRCNAEVKFETLARLAADLNAGRVATGHYARIEQSPGGGHRLLRACDAGKDQSYFLFDLTPAQMALAMFPLGGMRKEQVRAEALRLGLAGAGKPESQDVCFIEGGDYRDFLRSHAPVGDAGGREGPIVDTSGVPLGRHEGISGYTVGQRRGLGVSSSRRLYVVAVDASRDTVVLGGREDSMCAGLSLSATRFDADAPGEPFPAVVRVRYRHAGANAMVRPLPGGRAEIDFEEPLPGVSPGQAAVCYDGDRVLGGGWIDTVRRTAAA